MNFILFIINIVVFWKFVLLKLNLSNLRFTYLLQNLLINFNVFIFSNWLSLLILTLIDLIFRLRFITFIRVSSSRYLLICDRYRLYFWFLRHIIICFLSRNITSFNYSWGLGSSSIRIATHSWVWSFFEI